MSQDNTDTVTLANGLEVQAPATPQEPLPAKPIISCGKFTGTFAGFALGLYNSLKSADKTNRRLWHLVCVDYMNDIARGIKADTAFKSKVGKANEKKDSCKIKGSLETAEIISSNSMKVARVMQQIDDLVKEKVIAIRFFPSFENLPDAVQVYLKEKTAKVGETLWEKEKTEEVPS